MWKLFWMFFKVGMLMFGGGYTAYALVEKQVLRYRILTRKELLEIMSIASAVPGPNSVILATFIGRKYQGGVWGSLVAVLGVLTPPIIVLFLFLSFFNMDFDNTTLLKALLGIRIALIVIILKFVVNLLKQFTHWVQYIFFALSVTLFLTLQMSPIVILLGSSIVGLLTYPILYQKDSLDEEVTE